MITILNIVRLIGCTHYFVKNKYGNVLYSNTFVGQPLMPEDISRASVNRIEVFDNIITLYIES